MLPYHLLILGFKIGGNEINEIHNSALQGESCENLPHIY